MAVDINPMALSQEIDDLRRLLEDHRRYIRELEIEAEELEQELFYLEMEEAESVILPPAPPLFVRQTALYFDN